jgi:hypothetical protein
MTIQIMMVLMEMLLIIISMVLVLLQQHLLVGMRNDFPPLLMRRYELRILPIGRRGSLFPFQDQYISYNNSMNTPPVGV